MGRDCDQSSLRVPPTPGRAGACHGRILWRDDLHRLGHDAIRASRRAGGFGRLCSARIDGFVDVFALLDAGLVRNLSLIHI